MIGLYAVLLRLYPRPFRERFASGMAHAFERQHLAARERGLIAWIAFWTRTVAHAFLFGIAERLRGRRHLGASDLARPREPNGPRGSSPGPRLRGVPRDLLGELGHALRRLARSPGFTIATVVTLALGMGATLAIYAVVHSVILSPLPYPAADRLVWVGHTAPGADIVEIGTSYGAHHFYRAESRAFDDIVAYHEPSVTLTDGETPERVRSAVVTPGFFDLFLGRAPTHGRTLTADDDAPGVARVAVISHGLWQRRFSGDPAIVGRSLELDGNPIEIVGVLPRSFDYPSTETEVWLPAQRDPAAMRLGGFGPSTVARLREGFSADDARRDLERLIARLHEPYAGPVHDMIVERGRLAAIVTPLRDRTVGDVERTLWILLGTVAFVLLTACANVANLFLVRGEGRRREVAVRRALGAGRARILRYHASEGLLLGIVGGALGLLLARIGIGALVRNGPDALPRLHEVAIDGPVLGFGAVLALVAGVVFGLVPAMRRRAASLVDTLRDGARGAAGPARARARQLLIAVQVAFAALLLVGAGLMVRSFLELRQVDPGFVSTDVLTFRVALSGRSYPDGAEATRFQRLFAERIAALDGVDAVGSTDCLPLSGCWNLNPLYDEGQPFEEGSAPPAVDIRAVSTGFFDALRIPLLSGRLPDDDDLDTLTGAVVVSRSLADLFWPGEDPIGRRVFPDLPLGNPWYTIVGVVGEVRSASLLRPPGPTIYLPFLDPNGDGPYAYSQSYVVRGSRAGIDLAAAVRSIVTELDPGVAVAAVTPLSRLVADAAAPTAFTMTLLVIAGGIALVLGAVGVYGVLSYAVGQRNAEIGVRMALGARAGAVRSMVLRQGMGVAATGLLVGIGAALLLSRVMGAVLYGVEPHDPITYGAVTVVLLLIAVVASYLPARHAASLDPVEALRD